MLIKKFHNQKYKFNKFNIQKILSKLFFNKKYPIKNKIYPTFINKKLKGGKKIINPTKSRINRLKKFQQGGLLI